MPEPAAREALDTYVHAFDVRTSVLPRHVEPALVERFLLEEAKKVRPSTEDERQLTSLALWYETRGVVEDWLAFLDCREPDDFAFATSLKLVEAAGVLGDEAQQEMARSYFSYLISLPPFAERIDQVLRAYWTFASPSMLIALRRRVDEAIAALAPTAQSDWNDGRRWRRLKDVRTNDLSRIEWTMGIQADILAAGDPARRIDREVEAFLELGEGETFAMATWSERRLRAEARDGHAALIVAAFRRAVEEYGYEFSDDPMKSASPKAASAPTNNAYRGRLAPEVIQSVVRANAGMYCRCYESALAKNATLQGRVTVRFVIQPDGSVQKTVDGGSDLPDASVVQCVVASFGTLAFPPPPGGGYVTVAYPIMFSPGSDRGHASAADPLPPVLDGQVGGRKPR